MLTHIHPNTVSIDELEQAAVAMSGEQTDAIVRAVFGDMLRSRRAAADAGGSARAVRVHGELLVNVDSDASRVEAKQRQIDLGKNTLGYDRYRLQVRPSARTPDEPSTPDVRLSYGRTAMENTFRRWRRELHSWDLEYDPMEQARLLRQRRGAEAPPATAAAGGDDSGAVVRTMADGRVVAVDIPAASRPFLEWAYADAWPPGCSPPANRCNPRLGPRAMLMPAVGGDGNEGVTLLTTSNGYGSGSVVARAGNGTGAAQEDQHHSVRPAKVPRTGDEAGARTTVPTTDAASTTKMAAGDSAVAARPEPVRPPVLVPARQAPGGDHGRSSQREPGPAYAVQLSDAPVPDRWTLWHDEVHRAGGMRAVAALHKVHFDTLLDRERRRGVRVPDAELANFPKTLRDVA